MHAKLREESSRFISNLLIAAIEACQTGDMDLPNKLGLSIQTLRKLDQLRADQISSISGNYVRDLAALDILKIDEERISMIVDLAAKQREEWSLVDEYLRRGACKTMMADLFGLRSTQVASRKKFLNLKTVKGRLKVSTAQEQRLIYDAWLESIKISDFRERLIYVGRKTNLSMSMIYREAQEIEKISNTKKTSLRIA